MQESGLVTPCIVLWKHKGCKSQIFHNLMFCPNDTNKMPQLYCQQNRCRIVFMVVEAGGFDPPALATNDMYLQVSLLYKVPLLSFQLISWLFEYLISLYLNSYYLLKLCLLITMLKLLCVLYQLSLTVNMSNDYCFHFTEKKFEAQGGLITCPWLWSLKW